MKEQIDIIIGIRLAKDNRIVPRKKERKKERYQTPTEHIKQLQRKTPEPATMGPICLPQTLMYTIITYISVKMAKRDQIICKTSKDG